MSTNYYVRTDICTHCGVSPHDSVHIGKSSLGWKFLFNGIERKTKGEWLSYLTEHEFDIYDEYGQKVTLESLLGLIRNKAKGLDSATYSELHPELSAYGDTEEWIEDDVRFSPREFS